MGAGLATLHPWPNRVEGSDERPPPTPPGMRGRTGRFRSSRCRGTVVQDTPRWPPGRDPLSPPPRVGQGALDETVARHPPGPLAAARGPMDVGTRAPQGQPVASPGDVAPRGLADSAPAARLPGDRRPRPGLSGSAPRVDGHTRERRRWTASPALPPRGWPAPGSTLTAGCPGSGSAPGDWPGLRHASPPTPPAPRLARTGSVSRVAGRGSKSTRPVQAFPPWPRRDDALG
jgi:hypothetical protein